MNAPSDAGVETPDAGVPPALDAGPDGGTTDTGTDADASFCARNGAGHDFCEDFDRPVQIGGDR